MVEYLNRPPDEDRIAVPADTVGPCIEGHGAKAMGFKGFGFDGRTTRAKAAVRLLQHGNIWRYFVEHVKNAFRAAQSIQANRLVDVIGRQPDHRWKLALRFTQCNVIFSIDDHIIM